MEIEVSEALAHQIREEVAKEDQEKRMKELEDARKTGEKLALEKYEIERKQNSKELEEERERSKKWMKQVENLMVDLRSLRRKDEERDTQMKQMQVKIEEETRKKTKEEEEQKFRLLVMEKDKKMQEMMEKMKEMEAKMQQGSQQTQGEVLELDFEKVLRESFPDDDINPVEKGVRGADIIHIVKGKSGKIAGVILWETKRANWQASWLAKLREDSRNKEASVAVLVSTELPKDIRNFQLREGIIITSYTYALPLAAILRRSILQTAVAKQLSSNKDEDLRGLHEYLQSDAFRHRFEAFTEGIDVLRHDLESERNAMERLWKKREVQIKKLSINTSRMYGELQGIMGSALPTIKNLELNAPVDQQQQSLDSS